MVKPASRGASSSDLMRPEILLAIAAILTIIGGIVSTGGVSILIALIMLGAAAIELKLLSSALLEKILPLLSVSAVCGLILLSIGVIALATPTIVAVGLPVTTGINWGGALVLISGLISLFATYQMVSSQKLI